MKLDSERNLTELFINSNENTMSESISNSAALFFMSILEEQFEEFSKMYKTGDIDPYSKDSINEIEAIYEKSKSELIQYVKKQQEGCIQSFRTKIKTLLEAFDRYANQSVSELDQVTLPNLGNEYHGKKTLPLKLIFSAVWRALIDDNKFTIHDKGGSEEKIEQARKDKRDRVLTLLNRLNEIKEEGVCHHGIRHKLIFSLNGLYRNRFIIEDTNAFIIHQLRENILIQFEEQYKNKTSAPKLLQGMLEWIISSDAEALLTQIDPKKEIIEKIKIKLYESGIKKTLSDINEDNPISKLPFSCDPKQHPEFYALHRLMCLSISPNRETAYNALEKIKCIIIHEFTLDKDKNISEKIIFIVDIFNLYKELLNLEVLFSVDGSQALWKNLHNATHQLIQAQEKSETIEINKTIDLEEKLSQATKKIKELSNASMKPEIENFFVNFFVSLKSINNNSLVKNALKQIKFLYGCLLNENFKRKIILNDGAIEKIFKKIKGEGKAGEIKHFIDLTPYFINRFLLQAILQKPENWSPLFFEKLKDVLSLLDREHKQGLNTELKKHSYQEIINQIKYLINLYQWKNDQTSETKEPNRNKHDIKIILPEDIRTLSDFIYMIKHYPEKLIEALLTTHKMRFEKIFELFFKHYLQNSINSYSVDIILTEVKRNDKEIFFMGFLENFMFNLISSNKSNLLTTVPATGFLKEIRKNNIEKFRAIKDAFINSLFKTENKLKRDLVTLFDFVYLYYSTSLSDQTQKTTFVINTQQSKKIQEVLFKNKNLIHVFFNESLDEKKIIVFEYMGFLKAFIKSIEFPSSISIDEFIETIRLIKAEIRKSLFKTLIAEFKNITPTELKKIFSLIPKLISKPRRITRRIKRREVYPDIDEADLVLFVQNNLSDMDAQEFIELIQKIRYGAQDRAEDNTLDFIKNNIKKINNGANEQLVKIICFLPRFTSNQSDHIKIIQQIATRITNNVAYFSYQELIFKIPIEFRLEFIIHTIHKCKSITYENLLSIINMLSSKHHHYEIKEVLVFTIFIKNLLEEKAISFHAELFISLSKLITNNLRYGLTKEERYVRHNSRLEFINEYIDLSINIPLCQDKKDFFFEHVIQFFWKEEKILYFLHCQCTNPLTFINSSLLSEIQKKIENFHSIVALHIQRRKLKEESYGIFLFKIGINKAVKLQVARKVKKFIGALYTYEKKSPQKRILILTKEEAQAISENKSDLISICRVILNELFGSSIFEKIEAFSRKKEVQRDAIVELIFSRKKGGIEYTLTQTNQYNSLNNYNLI